MNLSSLLSTPAKKARNAVTPHKVAGAHSVVGNAPDAVVACKLGMIDKMQLTMQFQKEQPQ